MNQKSQRKSKIRIKENANKTGEESRSSFLTFVKKVWPEFIAGSHHKIIAQKI